MLKHALSLGGEVDVWKPRSGVVHSVFERAVNLLIDGELWTVLTAREDAPFGIQLAPALRAVALDVRVTDRVCVRAGHVSVGSLVLDCRVASRWQPTPWTQPAGGLAARLFAMEQVARQRAWPESAMMASDVAEALHQSATGSDARLADAIRRTVGRGPGLTPAGDDVLVGMLVVLTSGAGGVAGVRATSRLVAALAPTLGSTPDVSRHLLGQAARGLPGRALHDLGKALVEGAPRDVLAGALDRVLDIGSTSGADACVGLAAASHLLFLTAEKVAA